MVQLQADAHARAEAAALELFVERGYERTTVDDIVERAGIARRTFFRYFAGKRELLFWGHPLLAEAQAAAVAAAPDGCSPLELAAAALHATADHHARRTEVLRRRQLVVATSAELQERQLLKYDQLSARLAGALERRGVTPVMAAVTASAAIGAYAVAFRSWADGQSDDLHATVAVVLEGLRTLDTTDAERRT